MTSRGGRGLVVDYSEGGDRDLGREWGGELADGEQMGWSRMVVMDEGWMMGEKPSWISAWLATLRSKKKLTSWAPVSYLA
jgi:hypothetical protein